MSTLIIYISFHAYLKNLIYTLKLRFIKTRDLSNEPYAKLFKIGILIYLNTLPKCWKKKITEKYRFSSQKLWTDRGNGQLAQSARVLFDRFLLPDRGLIERRKKHIISSSSLSFSIEWFAFPVEGNSHLLSIKCSNA